MAERKKREPIDLGPTGELVKTNVRRIREARGLTYAELSRRLERRGNPIAPLGLTRIETGFRRVDVDDLMALAHALDVNPTTLLLPAAYGENLTAPVTSWGDLPSDFAIRWVQGTIRALPPGGLDNMDKMPPTIAPRKVLTKKGRVTLRRAWIESQIEELNDELSGDLTPLDGDRIRGDIERFAGMDPTDDDFWATAEYDPAPPDPEFPDAS